MADEEYNRKLESLQQYIPFLNNMIAQLKDPRKKNREQQLAKMVSLHSMITDKKKKLKLETLSKCEDVILKLYEKVKSGSHSQGSKPAFAPPACPMSPITPSSPSPPRDIPKTKPVVIPTEKISDRTERDTQLCQPSSSFMHRIDIYSSAADSLKSSPFKPSVFERLGKKTPDMSKPPISIEDLEALQQDVLTERLSLNELTDLREKLQKQLSTSDEGEQARKSPINTTVRNTTILTKKAVEKAASDSKSKQPEDKPVVKPPVPNKPVKVIKEASSIFGTALSSIDNKIIEGAGKGKEKERRNSIGSKKEAEGVEKSKERRSSKEDKKGESSSHKSSKDKDKERDKDKTEKKSSEHRSRDKKEEDKKDKTRERKDEKRDKDRKPKEDAKRHESAKKEHVDDKKKEEVRTKDEKDKTKEEDDRKKDEEKKKEETIDKPKPEESKPAQPVYKRLADKYNPKPRKPSSEASSLPDVPKKVSESIENNMKTNPIPFLEVNRSPPKLPALTLPLLSPTSSTGTVDNEVATFTRKLIPTPQPVPNPQIATIPSHVTNILANPNNTALINSVVNQFKARPTALIPPSPNAFPPQPVPSPNQNFSNNNYAPNEMGNVHFNPPNQQSTFWQAPNAPNRMQPPPQNHPPHLMKHPLPVPHPHPQNFPQRSFTPIPNQFDNQIQPMDYYPPGSTPTHNPFNHQAPPMLSPQYDNFEPRPPRKPSDEPFKKDRDSRYRDDWRRMGSQRPRDYREPNRDPRLHRERERDRERDRNYRDDQRPTVRREAREYDRDNRNKFRDPRLNRFRYERDPEASRAKSPSRGRSPARTRSPTKSPVRQRARSVSKEGEDTFVSPLDSLYSGSDRDRRTGKGYGVQNFKIPKIKKEEDAEEAEPDAKKEEEVKASVEEKEEPKEEPAPVDDKKEPVVEVKEPETEVKATTSTEVAKETPESDENVASANVSSSTECDNKETTDGQSEVAKDTADVGEISSTNDIPENQQEVKPLDDESQTDIINKFLKKLLENERTRAAASLFIDNVSNSLDDEKLKIVVQTVKSAAVEEEPEKRPVVKKKKKLVKKSKLSAKLAAKRKQAVQRKLRLRKQRKPVRVIDDDDDDDEEEEETKKDKEKEEKKDEEVEEEEEEEKPEEVVVSVGERIKSRKRLAASPPKKRKVKHKTELDLLHEDIQDMFIRDGVLTATGKRMCRLLKNDETKPPPPEPRRRTRNTAEKFDSKANSEKLKAMSNVRVLIPKIPADKLSEIEDESQRYSLRRSSKSNKSYAEVDSEDEKEKEREKEKQRQKEREEELEKEKQREKEREKQKQRDKEKAKEKEKEKAKTKEKKKKIESDDEPEEKVQDEKDKPATPKKVKKRAKAWASGVLPKRKKKIVEDKEDDSDKSFELVEPDKNYFSSKLWHSKTPCKLCDYDGMNITKHYRSQHPESEVLSSRLSPQKAEDAIKQSLELGLDEKEDEMLLSTKRFSFVCRFCDLEMNCQPSNFYDHISTHTGEYRHICTLCDFTASNNKPLRIHYSNVHGKDAYNRAARTRTRVYGYICVECNFVQTNKKTVDTHVNVYHLGEGKQVLKIHLSTGSDKRIGKEDKTEEKSEAQAFEEEVDEEQEEEEEEEPKPKRKKTEEQLPPSPKRIKKEREIDMTVFTCNTDIQEENEQIEQERLRKMAELNESVKKTNRQSLNFVDQLSNRLLQEEKEAPPPEMVTVKSEPIDDEFLPELEAECVPEPDVDPEPVTPKKPVKVMEPPVSPIQVVQKDNSLIQGMIQKLQGKLKEEKSVDGPPPLAPLVERVEDVKAFLSAGFLNISKTTNGLEYACRVPSCLFTTTNRDGFVTHWTEDHTRINQSYKATKCRICSQEVTATAGATLLINFFAHVENDHLCKIKTSFNSGFISVDKDQDGFDYICRVHLCGFMTKVREVFVEHLNEHADLDPYKSTVCGICLAPVGSTSTATLLTNLFAHIENEHLEDEKIPSSRSVLRTRRLSGDKLSKAKEESPEAKDEEENPFPFKISGVMSLADETVPPLSPLREKPHKIESVILKEAKMTAAEKTATWKSTEAMNKFLQCPRELYKCPQFFCKYATVLRHLFEGHIKAHARVSDELVSCVYCDVKTPLSHAGLHIDLRHSNCLYSCSHCLYRALSKEYVMIHNKLKHKETDLIISLPPKTAKTIMMSKQKQFTVKEACPPYKCGSQGCTAEFLYVSDFCAHLQENHDGVMVCGFLNNQQRCNFQCLVAENMVDHWRVHNCFNLHCLVCKFGAMEKYSMLEHYSVTHSNMEPLVVDRSTSATGGNQGYSDVACSKIRYLNDELLESVNVQQFTILQADKPQFVLTTEKQRESPKPVEPPKNVTLVPLSILQPNSTESKKIIAIIPNTPTSKPVQLFTALNKETSAAPFVFASTSAAPEAVTKEKEPAKEDPVTVSVEESDNSVDNSGDNIVDPLSLEGEIASVVLASGDESDSQELNEAGDMLKSFGLIGYQLYRCAFCDISFSNTKDFKAHTMHSTQCRDANNTAKPYKCVHCERLFKNPHGLLEHIQYHGQLRFGCSLCVKKFPSPFALRVHMRGKHSVSNTITTPVVPTKTNMDRDEFILRPVSTMDSDMGKEGPSIPILGGLKSIYSPDEIDKLPKRYIFNSDVKCALCSYSTKVRTNLVRHLQFHSAEKSVPDIAPVNPVPCLDKNERMFDKMTNLALSSIAGATSRMGGVKTEPKAIKEEQNHVPAYVPLNRRYVCCADGCNYLCLEEANLRHHLHALHVQEPSFTCAHCKLTLKTDVEVFLKHLKLHDLHLYKCSGCSFVHNLRHKVDKHAADKHEKGANTITIRALEAEIVDVEQSVMSVGVASAVDPPPASNIKWTKPWHCGMCKYRCAAKSDILAHIFNKHDINAQFKCTLCSYKSDDKSTFEGHFKDGHPNSETDIIYVYYKSEGTAQGGASQKQFDTTPLWQRDRPRVRHIRGILFEETSPQKGKKGPVGRPSTVAVATSSPTTPVTPTTTSVSNSSSSADATPTGSSNLDLAIDAVAKGIDECSKNLHVGKEETKEAPKIDETVIVIDDDDDDEDETPRLDDSADNELLIDIDSGETPEVKTEVEREFLSEDILFNMYGKLCAPVAKAFKCPICLKYRNRKVGPFVYHMLTELKCYRFKCNSCDFASVTFDTIATHCQEKHDSVIASNVKDIPLDKTVEYWLQILIKYQAKAIVQQIFIPTGEASLSSVAKLRCDYCDKWFKNLHLLKDHELYHWADHVYTCNHCHSEHVTLNELFQHTFMSHPTYDVDFSTSGPYVSKVLFLLKTPQTTTAPPPQPGASTEEVQYACTQCSEVERSVEALRKHASECHEGEEASYKVVVKAKVQTMFCCSHCHERGPEKVLREHHREKHDALKFTIYQYICLECSGTFLNIKDLRAHFGKAHSGKKLTYSCIENKPGGAKEQFCCTKCPFRSCSVSGIRGHLRKHLRPIDCLLCGATFIFPTEARAHHNKEHVHSAERVEENKDKLKEYEDLVQQIVAAKERGDTSAAFAPPPRKMLARKSTGAPFVREYSFYGSKKEDADLKGVSTSIEVNKVTKKMSAEQFSNLFNIFPVVEVNDCESKEEEA
ncbi:uncharacterized protein LOC135140610 isoform X4 [Zophobas morio]|uniref:uncharacterized protein LOC135140610 isoform X4 n=1 Tax=Zophobas morio TaxID=2755281 RepID=UPI0030836682